MLDALGRTPIASAMKAQIADALRAIPDGKRGAILVIANETVVRAHVAAKIGNHWKVAAGVGFLWNDKKPEGFVGVEGSW